MDAVLYCTVGVMIVLLYACGMGSFKFEGGEKCGFAIGVQVGSQAKLKPSLLILTSKVTQVSSHLDVYLDINGAVESSRYQSSPNLKAESREIMKEKRCLIAWGIYQQF